MLEAAPAGLKPGGLVSLVLPMLLLRSSARRPPFELSTFIIDNAEPFFSFLFVRTGLPRGPRGREREQVVHPRQRSCLQKCKGCGSG